MNHSSHRGNFQSRGLRGGGNRGRGRGFNGGNRTTVSSNVPTVQQVIPGAKVSIVLKADQPTGHEVQGTVADLLTNGNHPRGIKVRLQDGRVGRVQRMVKDDQADSSSAAPSQSVTSVLENLGSISITPTPVSNPLAAPSKYSDFRTDGYAEPEDAPAPSLEDYIVVKKPKGKGKGQKKKAAEEPVEEESREPALSTNLSVCPVCDEFEGDETAVAHHVESHFA